MPAVQPLVTVVKALLKQRDLNDASRTGLSSFGIDVMVRRRRSSTALPTERACQRLQVAVRSLPSCRAPCRRPSALPSEHRAGRPRASPRWFARAPPACLEWPLARPALLDNERDVQVLAFMWGEAGYYFELPERATATESPDPSTLPAAAEVLQFHTKLAAKRDEELAKLCDGDDGRDSLGDLLLGFLSFYSRFDFAKTSISLHAGYTPRGEHDRSGIAIEHPQVRCLSASAALPPFLPRLRPCVWPRRCKNCLHCSHLTLKRLSSPFEGWRHLVRVAAAARAASSIRVPNSAGQSACSRDAG